MLLPRLVRKTLAIFRGGLAPALIILSAMLGFTFGLLPGFTGLHVLLIVITLILNVHVGLFLISASLAKTLLLAAAPAFYYAGEFVLTHLTWLINLIASVPVAGLTDFSRYAIAGGVVLGPVIGLIFGLVLTAAVIKFRKKMIQVEQNSEKFQKWYSNKWVRIVDRILISKRTKDAKSLFPAKTKYIRIPGIVFAVIILAGFFVIISFIDDEKLTLIASQKLTQANKAEVNISSIQIKPLQGFISSSGIEVTDSQQPSHNQFEIGTLIADASLYNLLIGKIVLNNIEIADFATNKLRTSPGKVIADTGPKAPVFDVNDLKVSAEDIANLEKYFKNAQKIKDTFQRISRYLPDKKASVSTPQQLPESYLGYLNARTSVPPRPVLLAKNISLENVDLGIDALGISDIRIKNISDAPAAAKLPVNLDIKSRQSDAAVTMNLDFSKMPVQITGNFQGLDLSKIDSGFNEKVPVSLNSGKASGQITGTADAETIDINLAVDLTQIKASLAGTGILGLDSGISSQALTAIENMKLSIRLVGPTSDPQIVMDTSELTEQIKQSLVAAGKNEIKNRLESQLDEKLGQKLKDKIPGDSDAVIEKSKDLIKGLGGFLNKEK